MTEDFLPKDYQPQAGASRYTKLQPGENKIRILSKPILGHVFWERSDGTVKVYGDKNEQGDKPVRMRLEDSRPDKVKDPTSWKEFWAMCIYNYSSKEIEILEITQVTIQRAIAELWHDEDWGSPRNYDLVINRVEGEKTTYSVRAKPKSAFDAEVAKRFEEEEINLNALYEGKDPFKKEDLAETVAKAFK